MRTYRHTDERTDGMTYRRVCVSTLPMPYACIRAAIRYFQIWTFNLCNAVWKLKVQSLFCFEIKVVQNSGGMLPLKCFDNFNSKGKQSRDLKFPTILQKLKVTTTSNSKWLFAFWEIAILAEKRSTDPSSRRREMNIGKFWALYDLWEWKLAKTLKIY